MSQSSSTYTATIYNVRITTSSGSSSGSTGGTTTTAHTLKGAMSGTFGKVGNAVNLSDLRNSNTLAIIKKDFNSITMENETKPDAVLGYSPTLISTSEAKSRGYIIPDGYAESTVPVLNYSNIDEVLKIAFQNGLSVRFHTMVWHQQTPVQRVTGHRCMAKREPERKNLRWCWYAEPLGCTLAGCKLYRKYD